MSQKNLYLKVYTRDREVHIRLHPHVIVFFNLPELSNLPEVTMSFPENLLKIFIPNLLMFIRLRSQVPIKTCEVGLTNFEIFGRIPRKSFSYNSKNCYDIISIKLYSIIKHITNTATLKIRQQHLDDKTWCGLRLPESQHSGDEVLSEDAGSEIRNLANF